MPYITVDPAQIDDLNRGLARLMRPSHLRGASYVTDFYALKITHPTTGETALLLPETETVPLHIKADGAELQSVLDVFVGVGAITEEERDEMLAAVFAYAGQEVRLADFIPQSWADNVFTHEQLDAEGWFLAEPELDAA